MYVPVVNMELILPNGLLVNRELLESEIKKICHYVQHTILVIKDDETLLAMIFPNRSLFTKPDYERSPEEGCFCPRSLPELGKCLSGCLQSLNHKLLSGNAKIDVAVIINTELSVSDGTLTSDLKPVVNIVTEKYGNYMRNLFGEQLPVKEDVFNMILE
jgi:long-subunit acyl-CoA synthetase (AMP-forming)